jgi:hypothetical protein
MARPRNEPRIMVPRRQNHPVRQVRAQHTLLPMVRRDLSHASSPTGRAGGRSRWRPRELRADLSYGTRGAAGMADEGVFGDGEAFSEGFAFDAFVEGCAAFGSSEHMGHVSPAVADHKYEAGLRILHGSAPQQPHGGWTGSRHCLANRTDKSTTWPARRRGIVHPSGQDGTFVGSLRLRELPRSGGAFSCSQVRIGSAETPTVLLHH